MHQITYMYIYIILCMTKKSFHFNHADTLYWEETTKEVT